MSTSVSTAFVRQYEADVHDVFQRMGGILRVGVRTVDGVMGTSTTFQKVGTGMASVKARHGIVTPMNQDHTAIVCTLSEFYAGDWVDKLDEFKMKFDEKMAIARAGAWALGRKVDDQILTALDGTTQTGATIGVGSAEAIENTLLAWVGALDSNDVPNDGRRFGIVTPKAWQFMMKIDEFKSSDYQDFGDGRPVETGAAVRRFKNFLGVNWTVHNGIQGVGTSTAKCFVWHADSVGYATGAVDSNKAMDSGTVIAADITWHGDRVAHFVNHWMSGGACLIDDLGVIQADFDDTAALPTS